jgi:hypothetical protein
MALSDESRTSKYRLHRWIPDVQSGTAQQSGPTYDQPMLKDMTRSKLIQMWFAAMVLVVVAGVAFGAAVTVATGAMLLTLGLVPPAIVLLLWPGVQPPTAAEVLHGVDRPA